MNSGSLSGGDVFDLPYSIESRILEISVVSFKNEACMKVSSSILSSHETLICSIMLGDFV